MEKFIKHYVGEPITLELLGKTELSGTLVDWGADVLVLFKQDEFFYIPFFHIREIELLSNKEASTLAQPDAIPTLAVTEMLSLEKILLAAKGTFVEIDVTAAQPLHGHITNTLDDYIVFSSPIYQTMLIPFQHIKRLTPYPAASRPYGFNSSISPLASTAKPFATTFDNQLEDMIGTFATCNIGDKKSISGKLLHKEDHFISLLTVKEKQIHVNIHHIKTITCT
ncbi:DUF2642 domain-containing protein [Pseudobacillus sp. 179-B 2D1 NHS]|uniref:DUF2642 domain-containing protein n=1 Tax=Pseudobacillus sp. 179-B 2D1 NHS TaxID=3374292 RepID=UPI003879B77C